MGKEAKAVLTRFLDIFICLFYVFICLFHQYIISLSDNILSVFSLLFFNYFGFLYIVFRNCQTTCFTRVWRVP